MGEKHNLQEVPSMEGTKHVGEKENALSAEERNNCYYVKNSSYILSHKADKPK